MDIIDYFKLLNISESSTPGFVRIPIVPGSRNRSGVPLRATSLTIHETANHAKGADALAHARYLQSPEAGLRLVSWHFTVDSQRIVQHLPVTEVGWHTAVHSGNHSSLGIEICVNEDGVFGKACANARILAGIIAYERGFRFTQILPHKSWSGKNCPATLLSLGQFSQFVMDSLEVARQIKQKVEGK
jgi:N-acetylmuramoyl-L-alanine amidase